ncbi:hypothetical protein ABTK65_20405, partial [Acinetobacter baumannii]
AAAAPSDPAAEPQQHAGAPAPKDPGNLGQAQQGGGNDIIVTARRRNETIQNVPIAISVIGGTAVAETGAYNVNRLTQLVPSL